MINTAVFYTARARKDLQKLEASISRRIEEKISQFAMMSDPLVEAKPLQGQFTGLYRYRVGDYRAIFSFDNNGVVVLLTILTIKHRKDIYR